MLGQIASPHGVPQLPPLSVELWSHPLTSQKRDEEMHSPIESASTVPSTQKLEVKCYKDCFQEGTCTSVISPVCRCIRINSGKASYSLKGYMQMNFGWILSNDQFYTSE